MWWLDPWQFLAAFALDFFIGHPSGSPRLLKFKHGLILYYRKSFVRVFGESPLGGFLLWLIVTGIVLGVYWTAFIVLEILPGNLRWWLDIAVLYQCLPLFEADKQVRAIARPLVTGHIKWAQEKLALLLESRRAEKYGEEKIYKKTTGLLHDYKTTYVVGPFFWALLLGIPGILVYKTAALLAELVHPSNPAHAGFHQVPSQIFNLLNYVPKKIKDIAMRFVTDRSCYPQSASLQGALSLAVQQYWRMAMLFYCAAIIISAVWWIGSYILVPQQQNSLIY